MKSVLSYALLIVSLLMIAQVPAAPSAKTGKKLAEANLCTMCHGKNGISTLPFVPNLAGQKEAYLVKQLKAFKDGKRVNKTMNDKAKDLTPSEMADLASFFSSLK